MRHDFLDRYSRLQSPIHTLPAWLKLGAALGVLVGVVSVPLWSGAFLAGAAGFLIVVAAVARIPPRFLIVRLLAFLPFVVGIALFGLLRPDGLTLFLSTLARSTLCIFTMILLSNTTPFNELLGVLRHLRIPAVIVTVLALMYRYVFVLIDEAERMNRARKSRTFLPGRQRSWRLVASVIGQLFVRSTERAERIYAAMTARGWR